MTDELRNRIKKVYELVQRGSTEGERQAARKALDRLIEKYNLNEDTIGSITKKWYFFTYATDMEHWLLCALVDYFIEDPQEIYKQAHRRSYDQALRRRCKEICLNLEYLDYVTLDSAYEYFRRHMKSQWNKTCAPLVSKCRKARTRSAKRKDLQPVFFEQYLIASKLVKPDNLKQIDTSSMSEKEKDKLRALQGLEGGQYHTQVQSGHLLESGQKSDVNGQIALFF